jgi:S-DNA-T family DNA segregation ATPase FtsK/SpoIIIE
MVPGIEKIALPAAGFGGVLWLAMFQPWILWGVAGVVLAVVAWMVWLVNRAGPRQERPVREAPPVGMETGIPLGEFVTDGDPWCPPLAWTHAVIGGIPDSGKSNTINVILASLAWMPDVQILAIDPKGGVELGPWEKRLAAIASAPNDDPKTGEPGWVTLLTALRGEVKRRERVLRRAGLRKITPAMLERFPWIVLVIDEMNEILHLDPVKTRREAVEKQIMSLISVARACGVSVIIATQKPANDSIPTGIRDLAALRIAHATTTPEMTDVILGRGATTNGADANRIKLPMGRGIACVWDAISNRYRWVKMRYVTDEEVRVTADVTAVYAKPWNLGNVRPFNRERPRRPSRKVPTQRSADSGHDGTEATG